MTNAKKIITITTLTIVLTPGIYAVSYAASKGFDPLMIPVDKENLPEHFSEGNLEDGHVSAHS